jgi:hypothetical protein
MVSVPFCVVAADGLIAGELQYPCHLAGGVIHLVAAVGPQQGRDRDRREDGNHGQRNEKLNNAVTAHFALGVDYFLHDAISSQDCFPGDLHNLWTSRDAGGGPSRGGRISLITGHLN